MTPEFNQENNNCPQPMSATVLSRLLLQNRSIRRFIQNDRIPVESLMRWVGNCRYCASGRNLIQLLDKDIASNCLCDDGIQLQTLGLSACAEDYGCCIIKAFNNAELRNLLQLPGHLQILHVLALGRPKEKVVIEEMQGGDVKYWRTEDGVHHVPKRPASELVYRVL